jgi:hypothetical protein
MATAGTPAAIPAAADGETPAPASSLAPRGPDADTTATAAPAPAADPGPDILIAASTEPTAPFLTWDIWANRLTAADTGSCSNCAAMSSRSATQYRS